MLWRSGLRRLDHRKWLSSHASHTVPLLGQNKDPRDCLIQQCFLIVLSSYCPASFKPSVLSRYCAGWISTEFDLRLDCDYCSAFFPQALDQVNLNSEGLTLSIEEQLGALTLSELQTADSKSTVYLNGTAFQTDIFDITRESTKVFWLWHSCLP